MNILLQPDSLSLVGSMNDFEIYATADVAFVLQDVETGKNVVQHTYTPNENHRITLQLKDVILPLLSFKVSDSSDPYVQPLILKTYKATFTEVGTATPKSVSFSVLRAGVDRLSDSASNFLKTNFLTWQPNVKAVTYYSPEFLTYYAQEDCVVKCNMYFWNGVGYEEKEVALATLNSGKVWTIPVQYAIIAKNSSDGDLPSYYDVWVESTGGTRFTYVQRYYASDMKSEEEEWFLFENSLGGIDCFRAYGNSENTAEHTHNVAEIEEDSEEYRVDTTRKFKKHTGYLDERERLWLLDFFPSLGKYHYSRQSLRQIVVTESDVNYEAKELPTDYSFTYKYADARPYLNLSRTDVQLTEMSIHVPDLGNFTIAPRLVEFSRLTLSGGALFPVQNPYSEEWGTTTFSAIYNQIVASMASSYTGGGGIGHTHANFDLLDALSYFGDYILYLGKKLNAGYADKAGELSEDSKVWQKFLRKDLISADHWEEILGKVRFLNDVEFSKGVTFKDVVKFLAGIESTDINNSGTIKTKNLEVTGLAHFFELVIDKIKSAGGAALFTPADGFDIDLVEEIDGGYRLLWRCQDGDGNQRDNMWKTGDQALCMSFNQAKVGEQHDVANKYYWALVTAVSDSAAPIEKDGEYYNYIEISSSDCDGTVNPEKGDSIVMLGYRGTDDEARQSAIYLSAYSSIDKGLTAPLFAQYRGINDFDLASHRATYHDAKGSKVVGRFEFEGGESLDDYIKDNAATTAVYQIEVNGMFRVDSDGKLTGSNIYSNSEDLRYVNVTCYKSMGSSKEVVDKCWWEISYKKLYVTTPYIGATSIIMSNGDVADAPAYVTASCFTFAVTEDGSKMRGDTLLASVDIPVLRDGGKGEDGNKISITSTSVSYATSKSNTMPDKEDNSLWSTTLPSVAEGDWLWTRTAVLYSDKTRLISVSVSRMGKDGTSVRIKSTEVKYAYSDGTETPPIQPSDSEFAYTNIQGVLAKMDIGDYLWSRATVIYTDGNSSVTYSVSRMGADAEVEDYEVAYALSVSGKDIPDSSLFSPSPISPTEQKPYLWTRTAVLYKGSSGWIYSYSVARSIKGKDGNSVTIVSTSVTYAASKENAKPSDSLFSADMPTLSEGMYLWTRTEVKYSVGEPVVSYSVSRIGKDGASVEISSTSVKYAVTDNNKQPNDSEFTYDNITDIDLQLGKYLWSMTAITYSDNTTTKTYAVSRIGDDGEQGKPGANGMTTHFAYAEGIVFGDDGKATGVSGQFSTTLFNGAQYIGTYTDNKLADSTDFKDYNWTKLKGERGGKGEPGIDGVSVQSADVMYCISGSEKDEPSDDSDWKTLFSDLSLSEGMYVWTATRTILSNWKVHYSGKQCLGRCENFAAVTEQYALSDSGEVAPTDGWGDTYVAKEDKWLWSRSEIAWIDGSHTYTNAQCVGHFAKNGKGALEILVNPQTVVFDTNDNGIVPTSTSKTAKISCYRDGVKLTNVSCGFNGALNCSGNVQDNGDGTSTVTVSNISQETIDSSTKVSVTSGYVEVSVWDKETGLYHYIHVPFQVDVSKYTGKMLADNKTFQTQYTEISNKYKDLPLKTDDELTKYTSNIKQTAREISLKVSEQAVGRRNMLPGSAFRKGDDGFEVAIYGDFDGSTYTKGYHGNQGIFMNGGVSGSNFFRAKSYYDGSNVQYTGLYWRGGVSKNIKVKPNTKYAMSCWVKCDRTDVTIALETIYKATETAYTDERKGSPSSTKNRFQVSKANTWQFISCIVTTDGSYNYVEVNFWVSHVMKGVTATACFCHPMFEEAEEYNGWTLSELDYDYVGGNLIDNSRTFASGGNCHAQTRYGSVIANGYNSESSVFKARMEALAGSVSSKYSLPSSASSGTRYALSSDWTVWEYNGNSLSDDSHYNGWQKTNESLHQDVFVVNQNLELNKDYIISWYAKCEGKGLFGAYAAGTGKTVYSEYSDGGIGQSTYGENSFLLTTQWKRFWMHVKLIKGSCSVIAFRQYRGDVSSANPAMTVYFTQPKIEEGATVTDWTEKRTDMVDKQALLATGIDIANEKITATADNFEVRNNSGNTTMTVDKDGNLCTNNAYVKGNINATGGTFQNIAGENIDISGASTFGIWKIGSDSKWGSMIQANGSFRIGNVKYDSSSGIMYCPMFIKGGSISTAYMRLGQYCTEFGYMYGNLHYQGVWYGQAAKWVCNGATNDWLLPTNYVYNQSYNPASYMYAEKESKDDPVEIINVVAKGFTGTCTALETNGAIKAIFAPRFRSYTASGTEFTIDSACGTVLITTLKATNVYMPVNPVTGQQLIIIQNYVGGDMTLKTSDDSKFASAGSSNLRDSLTIKGRYSMAIFIYDGSNWIGGYTNGI